jgi:hypothetical protein
VRPLIVPVDLGGSPRRCAVMPPPRDPPDRALVRALISHYRSERARPGQPLEVAFFHGALPHRGLLAEAQGCTVRLACHPGDLQPSVLQRLWDQGVRTLELEALSLQGTVLRGLRRAPGGDALKRLILGLRDRGFAVGLHLWPGLPGYSHSAAMDDLHWLCGGGTPRVDFVRILPALGLAGTELADWARQGRWTPMDLGQAVTTVVEMLDTCAAAGLAIARVGLQPRADHGVDAVAGPAHPDLRGLAEQRRFRRRMDVALQLAPRTRTAELRVHPADLSWARGSAGANIRALRADHRLPGLLLRPDPSLSRGEVRLAGGDEGAVEAR